MRVRVHSVATGKVLDESQADGDATAAYEQAAVMLRVHSMGAVCYAAVFDGFKLVAAIRLQRGRAVVMEDERTLVLDVCESTPTLVGELTRR